MRFTHEERSAITTHNLLKLTGAAFALSILALAGCRGAGGIAAPTRTLPTSIPAPTPLSPLPTVPPLGSEQNPVVFTIVVPDADAAADSAESLSQTLSSEAGLTVEVRVTEANHEAYRALCDRAAAAVTVDAFSYLAAVEQDCGEVAYVLQRNGETETRGQFIARDVFLPQSYRGVFCRPDPDSLNGWIVPTLTLRARGVDTFTDLYSIIDAGSDEEVIRMIEAGTCTLGATTAGAEQQVNGLEHPERLHVLEQLAPVPNEVVVVSLLVEEGLRARLTDMLNNHTADFASLMGGDSLVPISDAEFSDIRSLLTQAGITPASMGQ